MKSMSNVKGLVSCAVLLGAVMTAGASPAAGEEKSVTVPLKGVVLFTSGVGYFRHEGAVDGDARMELEFSTADVNDVLKSMILRDMGGGTISNVTYSPRDPVTRTLKSFAVDLTGNPTVAAILSQLRGRRVEASAPDPVRGTILGVEERVTTAADKTETAATFLNLLTAGGIVSLPLSQVQGIQFTDGDLQSDFNAALALIASSRDLDKKKVVLHFAGSGKRRVSVGYIQEAPVWKTSYRLAVGEDKTPFLQGWAVVENVTDRDWNEVALTLVSGRPITFVMDLYTPLYVRRPEVPLDAGVSLLPQSYEMAMDSTGAVSADEMEETPEAMKELAAAAKTKRAPAPAASAGGPRGEPGLELGQGVSAAARGAEVGELFQYAVKDPVTLPRRQSALFPIVNQAIGGEKFSIYNESVDPVHPLIALKLENKSGLHLMKGPMTVFDGGSYAGDALLSDFPAGAEQFVSYAVDLDTEVAPQAGPAPRDLFSVKISKGIVVTTYKQSRERDYKAINRGSRAKSIVIEHPFDDQWSLVRPKEPMERSRSTYRFLLPLGAGKTENLAVIEERTVAQSVSANNLPDDAIGLFVRSSAVSPAVKDALRKLLALKQKSAEAGAGRERIEARIRGIHDEQGRIRQNMERLETGSTLYNRYVKTLSGQEDELAALSESLDKARDEETARRKDVDDFILSMDVK